jgi:hypothetical protein
MKRFLIRAILFTAVLICITIALELTLAEANHLTNGKFRIGQDVYEVLEAAHAPHPQVTTLYLGDSVARQLFPMQAEPSPTLLYLCSNQAISVAGHYCILQTVMARAPHLRHVYLFYAPRSWSNNLDQIFTHDYFCGYFHTPAIVWETWMLKHDRQLTEAHIARMLLPNMMAENSYLNRSQSSSGVPLVPIARNSNDPVSPASRHFLKEMKDLCRQRQITLTVLPCPCIGTPAQFAQVAPVYDAPITLYNADLFLPAKVHLKNANIEPMRRHLIAEFHLSDGD